MPSKTDYKKVLADKNSKIRHMDFEIRQASKQINELKRENNELITRLHTRKWWQIWK